MSRKKSDPFPHYKHFVTAIGILPHDMRENAAIAAGRILKGRETRYTPSAGLNGNVRRRYRTPIMTSVRREGKPEIAGPRKRQVEKQNHITVHERNDLFQVLQALKTNRKKRQELGELFVEGIEPIKQALVSDRVTPRRLLFVEYDRLSDWAKNIVRTVRFEKIVSIRKELYDELSDKNEPSEIMATFGYAKRVLADVVLPENPFVVIFDRPSDHGNLGSLIRSANAFGVDLVVTHGHGVDRNDPKVIRSSLGAVFHTEVIHEESLAVLSDWLSSMKREKGLVVAGTDSGGTSPLDAANLKRPIALMLGNEAKGLSVRLKEISDMIVSIPMDGRVNSLNVACAGSILFWEIAKRGERNE